MAKIHKIKGRIRSVGKIQQITKAMEKVAASKMRRAQEATLRSRTYASAAAEALARLRSLTSAADHPLLTQTADEQAHELLIIFASDRGLAGAYHSNLFRTVLDRIAAAPAPQVIVVGEKGVQFATKLKGRVELLATYAPWPAEPTMADLEPLTATVINHFTQGTVRSVHLAYTDFVSSLKQTARIRQLLPIDSQSLVSSAGQDAFLQEATFEPSPRAVLDFVLPRLTATQIYQAALEAAASEHSMRMMAMKNASDNAEGLAHDLTLTYNGARQAAITQELAEISAGAEAIR